MNIGHDGLTDAFNNLETFQTCPDAEPSHYITSKYPASNISPTNAYSSDICEDTSSLNQTIYSEQTQESLLLQSHSPNTSFQILTDSLTSNCRNSNTFQDRLQSKRSAENSQTGEYDQSIISLPGTPTHSTQDLSNPRVSNLNSSTIQDNSSRIQSLYTIQSSESCLSLPGTTKTPILLSDTSSSSDAEPSNPIPCTSDFDQSTCEMQKQFDNPLFPSPNSTKSQTDCCSMQLPNLSNQSLCMGIVSQTTHADNTSKSFLNHCFIDSSLRPTRTLLHGNNKCKQLKMKPCHISLEAKIHTNCTKIPSKKRLISLIPKMFSFRTRTRIFLLTSFQILYI